MIDYTEGSGKQYHIGVGPDDIGEYVILPGDPKRVEVISSFLENVQELAFNREYRSIIGTYKGMKVIGISTGMGGSSVAIAIEELKNIGVNTMMRIGSAGALQDNINLGDLIICEGAIRDDGASKAYVDEIYPAIPPAELFVAFTFEFETTYLTVLALCGPIPPTIPPT